MVELYMRVPVVFLVIYVPERSWKWGVEKKKKKKSGRVGHASSVENLTFVSKFPTTGRSSVFRTPRTAETSSWIHPALLLEPVKGKAETMYSRSSQEQALRNSRLDEVLVGLSFQTDVFQTSVKSPKSSVIFNLSFQQMKDSDFFQTVFELHFRFYKQIQ